jgi:hypothetical protein
MKTTKVTGRTCVGEWQLSDLDLGFCVRYTGHAVIAPTQFASVGVTDRHGDTWLIEGTREEMIEEVRGCGYDVLDSQELETVDHRDEAVDILREFVEDVKLACGTEGEDEIDEDLLDWPDLLVTYRRAVKLLDSLNPPEASEKTPPPSA